MITARRARALAVLLVASVVLAGCWEDRAEPVVEGALVPTIVHGGTTGAAISFDTGSADQPEPPGEVVLDACRWRGPGLLTYDMSLHVPDGEIDGPHRFWVGLGVAAGDMGGGTGGIVTVESEGAFSVTINTLRGDDRDAEASSQSGAWAARPDDQLVCDTHTIIAGEMEFAAPVPLTIDVVDDGAIAPNDSVEALARTADPTSADDPWGPLRVMLSDPSQPAIDRLYLSQAGTLVGIAVRQDGPCLTVSSSYSLGPDPMRMASVVEVTQVRGCPSPTRFGPQRVIGIRDDVWTVEVKGPADEVDAFVEQMELRWFASVEPFTERQEYDPHAAADATLERDGRSEIARFEWSDGVVAIATGHGSNWGDTYDEVVATSEPFGGGGGMGTSCRDYSHTYSHDGERGFAYVVVEEPGRVVTLQWPGGEAVELDLVDATGNRQVAFVDISDHPDMRDATFEVLDQDGDPIPCDQSPVSR